MAELVDVNKNSEILCVMMFGIVIFMTRNLIEVYVEIFQYIAGNLMIEGYYEIDMSFSIPEL